MAKVDPGVQGRVYAARTLIAYLAMPIAGLIAGPLADQITEPAMQEGSALARLFAPLVGVGSGTGISVILVLTGLMGIGISMMAYLIPVRRHSEQLVPDHQSLLLNTPYSGKT